MSEYNDNKNIESFKIPGRKLENDDKQYQNNGEEVNKIAQRANKEPISSLSDGMFYEIDYDSGPVSGVGKFVLKSRETVKPETNEIRGLFTQMRDIARKHRSTYDYSRFFDKRVRNNNAVIFYEQGMFMKDFTDDYEGSVPFTQYFPSYQMMGYEQLRTYFTWRTKVRMGNVTDTSLSYAFLYIYELLSNIGVENPQEGLERLMFFWKNFSIYNKSIDKYVLQWLKDYHIYYKLPQSFKEFAEKNNLTEHYPKMTDTGDDFDLFCVISKYDIKKSVFFTDETCKMIADCFSFTIERIKQEFENAGIHFDDVFFRPIKKLIIWKPFTDALFHQWQKQPDRRVVLSENEIYICSNNEWKSSTIITTEKGRQFIGYVMKQMEAVLRQLTKYKFKISANIDMINQETLRIISKSGIFIEKIVPAAVMDFYKEMTKTVVKVDHASLDRIRQEAFVTQEALIVEEQTGQANLSFTQVSFPVSDQSIFEDSLDIEPAAVSYSINSEDGWESLKDALNNNELQALAVILQDGDIKIFADECGIMLEVLVDGINEKAMDYIGDNLMDEDFVLYNDYKEQVKELVR